MNETLQPGTHLDADQLSAFAEGVLPEHERALVLTHTAECARCREIAFLAQEPVPMDAPAAETARWWRVWTQPWVLGGAGALIASALLAGVFLWNRPEPAARGNVTTALSRVPEPVAQQKPEPNPARMDAPAPPAVRSIPMPSAPPSLSAGIQQPSSESQAARTSAIPAQSAAPATAMASAPPPAPAMMAKASVQPQEARAGVQDKSAYSMAAPLPPSAAAAGSVGAPQPAPAARASAAPIENAQVEQLPLYARNPSALRAAKARRREVAGPLHLQIEQGTGPNDGLARLTGTVLDPSGATIPGAVVRLSQPSTTAIVQAVTDGTGRFSLAPVPAGQYLAQVSAPGFASVTQQVDLLSRDVAQADAVLPVGAMNEAVEVSADIAMVANAEVATLSRKGDRDSLPSGLAVASMVSSGNRSVALDTAGGVFSRRTSKRWKQVKPRWEGKVVKLDTDNVAPEAKKARASLFHITTAGGEVWTSADGEHWVRR